MTADATALWPVPFRPPRCLTRILHRQSSARCWQFSFSAQVEKSTQGFTLTLANHFTLASGGDVTFNNGGGNSITEYLRPKVKVLLTSSDERDLFNIANNFGVKHHNDKQKTTYDAALWLSWMFYFYLATIHVVLRKIEHDSAEKL